MAEIWYTRTGKPWLIKDQPHNYPAVMTAQVSSNHKTGFRLVYIDDFMTGLEDDGTVHHYLSGKIYGDGEWLDVMAELPPNADRADLKALEFELACSSRIPSGLRKER